MRNIFVTLQLMVGKVSPSLADVSHNPLDGVVLPKPRNVSAGSSTREEIVKILVSRPSLTARLAAGRRNRKRAPASCAVFEWTTSTSIAAW